MSSAPTFDVRAYLDRAEGQHFDRKSLYEGPPERKRARVRRAVRDQVAEYCAGFANAEGGVLLLGVEDDGTVTGHELPADAVRAILGVPADRLDPPQPRGFTVEVGGRELIAFDVPMAATPVMVIGDGYPLRMGDRTVPASYEQIQALKFRGLVESWESRPSRMQLRDLDDALLERARRGSGLAALSNEAYLLKRKLADHRGRQIVLRQGAELLFAKEGPEHPNAGVRLFRVVGTERRLGAEHNVEERPRFEGNLPEVVEQVFTAIDPIIRRPARLVGSRFRTVPEYPEFSWKEAILNAVAHRDYSVEGRTTEVWFFDDRLEIRSPGGLIPDVRLDELLQLQRVHASRNPRTVRVLGDLGLVRDQGEGIPRMFAEMAGLFLPDPTIDASEHAFQITLRNTPTLTVADKKFVASLGPEELSDEAFRALLETYRAGRIDNARMRTLTGLDTLGASGLLRSLRDRHLLRLHPAGGASFYTLHDEVLQRLADRGGFDGDRTADRGGFDADPATDRGGFERGSGGVDADRGELDSGATDGQIKGRSDSLDLTDVERQMVEALGLRPRKERLRALIQTLAARQPWRPKDLAQALGRKDVEKLTDRHLKVMVHDGQLLRTHPDQPAHPEQAYFTPDGATGPPADGGDEPMDDES